MKMIIVAGGQGTRLRPITDHLPKPMVCVQGLPILEHNILLGKKFGITEYIFSLCYLPSIITAYFDTGKKWDVDITYTYEDECNPQGSAGAIREAKKYLDNKSFIVTYADILRQLDIGDMMRFHEEKGRPATINSYKRVGPNPKSMIEFDKTHRITAFYERPPETMIQKEYVYSNGSFYIFTPEIFDYIPTEGAVDFGSDVFPTLIEKEIYTYPTEDYFIDIGTIEKLQQAEQCYPGII